ncbi:TIGR04372 family glycosyltransferase [uncultured Nisaea sp.]|uniref:TIGR04372 family glycosyltransferase n=1 Tax=uncultured Nisaea sp. TaxID=538215 RepID=UPI0030EE0455|tara:strand:- start:3078 stop:4214 length:1137 start_codon:yes stop_codon:yes gene_type:complete
MESEFDLLKIYAGAGNSPDRPFKIAMPITAFSLGDVISAIILANRIASHFKFSHTTFLMREDRPYKRRFLELYHRPHSVVVVKPDEMIPLNMFNPHLAGRKYPHDTIHWQDLIVPPQISSCMYFWAFPTGRLRFKEEHQKIGSERLKSLGLAPDKWFVTLHYREPTYRWKKSSNIRDVDPAVYNNVIDWVIDELGGQVVRLGHPEMGALPARPGFVDLSRFNDSEMLQAYAVSRCAFYFGSPSGPLGFADAFQIPAFIGDSADFFVGYDNQIILTHTMKNSEGVRLRNAELMRSSANTTLACARAIENDAVFEKCTPSELRAGLDFMMAEFTPDDGWRETPIEDEANTRALIWPPQLEFTPRFFDPVTQIATRVRLFE